MPQIPRSYVVLVWSSMFISQSYTGPRQSEHRILNLCVRDGKSKTLLQNKRELACCHARQSLWSTVLPAACCPARRAFLSLFLALLPSSFPMFRGERFCFSLLFQNRKHRRRRCNHSRTASTRNVPEVLLLWLWQTWVQHVLLLPGVRCRSAFSEQVWVVFGWAN